LPSAGGYNKLLESSRWSSSVVATVRRPGVQRLFGVYSMPAWQSDVTRACIAVPKVAAI